MPEDGLPELPPHAFAKIDSSPDTIFYAEPRFVTLLRSRQNPKILRGDDTEVV